MLAAIGCQSRHELVADTVPAAILLGDQPSRCPLDIGEPVTEAGALAELRRHRRRQPGLAQLHRRRLPRHHHAGADPAQRAREPRLVHRLHALPGRDRAGPARGADELPADGDRPHRPRGRQRVAARRGHRRGRGDDADPARRASRSRNRYFVEAATHPQVVAVIRTRARWLGIEVDDRAARSARSGRSLRRAPADARYRGAGARFLGGHRRAAGRRREGLHRHRPAGEPAGEIRPAPRAPTSRSDRRSASACRSATAARMRPSWPPASRWSG